MVDPLCGILSLPRDPVSVVSNRHSNRLVADAAGSGQPSKGLTVGGRPDFGLLVGIEPPRPCCLLAWCHGIGHTEGALSENRERHRGGGHHAPT